MLRPIRSAAGRRLHLALVLGMGIGVAPPRADTYPRQPGIDALHYAFRLALRDDTDEIAGEATIDVRCTQAGLTGFALDLGSAAAGKGMTVEEVTSGGAALRFTHEADRLKIAFASPARAGERRQVVVRYRGVPASGLRIL